MNQKSKIQADSESSYDDLQSQQQDHQLEMSEQQNDSQDNDQQIKNKQQILQQQQKRIKDQLKDVPFGQLIKYKKMKQDLSKLKKNNIKKDRSKKQQPNERADKNAPRQIKIMKRPPKNVYKPIFIQQKAKSIDPRFESYAGNFNQDLATKSYSFIKDIQQKQINYLKKQIKNKKIKQQDKQILMKNYNKVTNDIRRFQHKSIQKKVKSDFRDKNYVPKKREMKQYVQKAKLDNLDSRSQDKRLKKKQKKIQKQRTIQKKKFMSRQGY